MELGRVVQRCRGMDWQRSDWIQAVLVLIGLMGNWKYLNLGRDLLGSLPVLRHKGNSTWNHLEFVFYNFGKS